MGPMAGALCLEACMGTVLVVALTTFDAQVPGKVLELGEAARRLGCTRRVVCRLVDEGELPAWRWGHSVRVLEDDLEAYRRRRGPAAS